jgi:hypothetical protein
MEFVPATGLNRRVNDRVAGPFDARRIAELETAVRICNLNEGGCFVNSLVEQGRGTELVLRIELPDEGVVTVHAEALYNQPEFGFAVRFTEMTEHTRVRLNRALHTLRTSPRRR